MMAMKSDADKGDIYSQDVTLMNISNSPIQENTVNSSLDDERLSPNNVSSILPAAIPSLNMFHMYYYQPFLHQDHVALSEEEKDKRDKRRLRNKEAAARCRKRRLDLMETLQSQVDQLREENKMKDSKIAELQLLKNELISVVHEHQCVLPESLRQTLGLDGTAQQQYIINNNNNNICNLYNNVISRKRPASELIPELKSQQTSDDTNNVSPSPVNTSTANASQSSIAPAKVKQEPTLYDVNNRDDKQDEDIKRPTSLSFNNNTTSSNNYNNNNTNNNITSSSGVPITTPSNLLGSGVSEFGTVNLLDGPTGLTPCHQPQPTAFPISSLNTPLGSDGRSFESL
ncbi:unnamed protein product [Anisakis simplex]|uniref:BZIP transcription factor FOS-1a (inferred by orthology to a C. elegans protein) n=1 Tax=Anisakis simplex TaxID=6269 RepID=A0A0M3JS82_ANISI|nr:unnamed protein product [Anisakis simplex]